MDALDDPCGLSFNFSEARLQSQDIFVALYVVKEGFRRNGPRPGGEGSVRRLIKHGQGSVGICESPEQELRDVVLKSGVIHGLATKLLNDARNPAYGERPRGRTLQRRYGPPLLHGCGGAPMSGEQGNKRQGRPPPMDPGPASTHDIIANQRRDVLCGVAEVRGHDEGGKLQPRVGLRRNRSGGADPRGDAGH